MYGKHILAIACSGILTAGMGQALAVEDKTADDYQETTSESGATSTSQTQSQTWSEPNDTTDDAMTKRGGTSQDESTTGQTETTAQDEAMAQTGQAQSNRQQTSGTDMSGKVVRNRQGERLGRIVGTLVDQSGRIQGYVVRTGKAGAGGENEYVVVPQEGAQVASGQSPGTGPMAQSGASGQGTQAAGRDQALTGQERLLHQQIQRQQLEIRLLRQQLARLQQSGMPSDRGTTRSGMDWGSGQARNAQARNTQDNPLSQVEHVVVDRFGRVQAVVLESGIVLAADQSAGGTQGQASRYAVPQDQSAGRAEQRGQRRQAVIIFDPVQQRQGNSEFSGSGLR